MAEFCLACYNNLHRTHLQPEDVIITDYLDLCEGCADLRQVVVEILPRRNLFRRFLRRFNQVPKNKN